MLFQHLLLRKFSLSEILFSTAKARNDTVLSYGNLMNERRTLLKSE